MCWWVTIRRRRSSTAWPRSASARSSSSSALAELGPLSTSVSGSSAIRYVLTRPTANGVGMARRWMPASAARSKPLTSG